MIVDAGARIRYTNRAMRELCGYASGELLGQSLNGLLPEAVAARHDGHMRHYVESGKASTVLGKVRSALCASIFTRGQNGRATATSWTRFMMWRSKVMPPRSLTN